MGIFDKFKKRGSAGNSQEANSQDAFAEMRRLMKENARRPTGGGGEAPQPSETDSAAGTEPARNVPTSADGGSGAGRRSPSEALAVRPMASISIPEDVVPERYTRELPPEFRHGIPEEAIALVKPAVARANGLLPYRFDQRDKTLHLALAEPPDGDRRAALDHLLNASARGLRLEFTPIPEEFAEHLSRLIDNHYPPLDSSSKGSSRRDGAGASTSLTQRYGFSQTLDIDQREIHARAAGTPKDFVDYLLYKGVQLGASDLQIDRFGTHTRLKFMIDGRGYLFDQPMEGDVCEKTLRVLKYFCDMPTTKVRKPKGASFKTSCWVNGELKKVRFRVEFSPSYEHERATVRFHTGREVLVDLDDPNIDPRSRETLQGIVDADQGLYAIVGRVGEGKSTTLHAVVLRHDLIDTPFASLQDPIEFAIEDVAALDIREHGLTYADGLKTVLRWGMPKTLLGEVRDAEVGRIALEAAKGGHCILTTFHAPDTVGSIGRLSGNRETGDQGLGWTPGDIADTIPAIFAQRLLPKLCPLCREPVNYREEELITAGFDPLLAADGQFFRPGREKCGGCRNGFSGRVLIIETLRFNNLIREILYENRHDTLQRDVRRAALEDGLVPLRESALGAVARGDVWLDDALRKTSWHEGDLVSRKTRDTKRVFERHTEMAEMRRALGGDIGPIGGRRQLSEGDPRDDEGSPAGPEPGEDRDAPEAPETPDFSGPSILDVFAEDEDLAPEQDEPEEPRPHGMPHGGFVLSYDEDPPVPEDESGDPDDIAKMFCTTD